MEKSYSNYTPGYPIPVETWAQPPWANTEPWTPPVMTREEREESLQAMAKAFESSQSLEGYQVLRKEYISHKFDPAMTIKAGGIAFNTACISKLDQAVYIHLLINPDTERMVIRTCSEGDRDAIRWCIAKDDRRKTRQITCKPFTELLYKLMGWKTEYRYKLLGAKTSYKGEPVYLFDLTNTEVYKPDDTVKPGEKQRYVPSFPDSWKGSYGLSVLQHEAATQLNLLEGYEYLSDLQAKMDGTNEASQSTEVIETEVAQ